MSKDNDIWESYTLRVTPAARKKPRAHRQKANTDKAVTRKLAEKAPVQLYRKPMPAQVNVNLTHALEPKRERSLREGSFEIDARLDLHGMTQEEACEALEDFMQRTVKAGARHLLIITGKGRGGEGVLRRHLPQWLGQLVEAKAILALRPAALRHGGDGAVYVILKRKIGFV